MSNPMNASEFDSEMEPSKHRGLMLDEDEYATVLEAAAAVSELVVSEDSSGYDRLRKFVEMFGMEMNRI